MDYAHDEDFMKNEMSVKNNKKINAIKLASLILQDANDYNSQIMVGDAINYVLGILFEQEKK